ncbi:MAG: DPP IV N-terminal domain-containing protein, partial [Longimicrobiales bacterium]
VHWSPDSKRLLVQRQDQREVEHHHYISYTPQRPVHYSQPYALPGDTIIPLPAFHILDIGRTLIAAEEQDGPPAQFAPPGNVRVELDPQPTRLTLGGSQVDSVWTDDSQFVNVSWLTRGSKSAHLARVDATTGEYNIIATDSARTFVEMSQRDPTSWYVAESTGDAFWWSERDGWAHIWRYGLDGTVKNQVTSGPWAVGAIWHVDEASQSIYFTAFGREDGIPYYDRVYRVGFDGSGLTMIAGEEGNHQVSVSPSGNFFVDSYSMIGTPPTTVLRRMADGGVLSTLEEADISRLEAVGWRAPEVFTVKARDGVTDIHGVIYFPDDLDESAKYPVIDHIYPGPQVGSVGSWSFKSGGEDFALAKLGFVAIQLDHMGTPQRSKAFHDIYYGDFNDNGLPDHVTAIKQLAARYPFMDLDRVGIYGHSGGGFASTDAMLKYPDFFSVAVSGAGNHDNASYNIYWSEKYQGLLTADSASKTTNFTEEANKTHVDKLKGKLLLMHGDMDDNVHPAMTVQLIDALTKANKDYDLVWAPDRAHGLNEPYFIRRRWDYFVEHLLGAEPPSQYEITRPSN